MTIDVWVHFWNDKRNPLHKQTQKSLKELQENTTKRDGIEQNHPRSKNGSRNNEENTKGDNSGDRSPRKEIRNHRCEHQQQNTRDGRENLRCVMDTTIKENAKSKKILTQNIQEIQDTMRRPNRIIGLDENEDFQLKGPANIFNKIIEENFPNLKNDMPMNIKEAYRTPNRLEQKRNSS